MADLKIHIPQILDNIRHLSRYLGESGIDWTLVAKVLGGNETVLRSLLDSSDLKSVHSIADARLSGVRTIKRFRPDLKTMYLKPPPVELADEVVRYADISLNSSRTTIRALNEAARRHGKKHEIIVMVEMGELREGIVREEIMDFYARIFDLPFIDVIGIGTNLGCMHGIEPNYDKLIQLSLYRQLIEAKFDHPLPVVSGSSSIALPLIDQRRFPAGVNHLRIGEAAFFGTSPLTGARFRELSTQTFDFSANIIEYATKDSIPDGIAGEASIGTTSLPEDPDQNEPSRRCIVDFGLLDVDVKDLEPVDKDVQFAGITSDMTVYDLSGCEKEYKVGTRLDFKPNYMAVARLMHSKYISKKIVEETSHPGSSGDGAVRSVEMKSLSDQAPTLL